ncbi:HD domain-containing phosphohydrolase [Deinococcus soli (ex Cha et al. 2016)]|uniref:PAS domain S-box-containing protein n=2 Tax=Deinococcus soli (ex Cha et al. 2016) TaxID=1309411 RepID=A0ACC6KEN2_9DEIO|nr:HD domain-containing phosphohydrolase [Deinococcus soli (ex Cha et al. 2016)]MDR6217910.1 PAS domain S-box-containing protein [Deinococcus soli (ex Cha et al. 2016)]MDR6328160.1 PAS domain S-box-containing protein [Deinococcus soli (ex Cha et al. 2016)]MDR6751012.1 PAS domain S-box-containing protein [Deinococcus soli (ex Cha et al. 2016)]
MTDPTLSQDAAHAVALGILTHFQRQADQGLIVLDERLHVADVTASLDARLDPDAEVRGQPLLELIHPEDQAAVPDDLLVQLHSGQDVHVEVRLNTRGVAVWCELDFLPVTPPQPGMWALAIVRDITPRKAAEQHARILEARRNALMDVAMDAIISIDRHGRVVAWNLAATNMFGYTLKEVLGQQLSALIIRPAERDAHQRGMARHQQTGETRVAGRRVQVTALHKSGHTLPVELMMKPVQIDGQQYYTAFIHDLTDQLEAQRRLREQALHLNMMQEQLPTLSWTTDPDLNVRMVSGQTLQRLRLDPRALVGRHVTTLLGGGREEDIVGAHLSALAGQRGRYMQRVQDRVFEIHVSPLHDTFDRVVGTVALAHDVTDSHREQLLEAARAQVLRSIAVGEPLPDTLRLLAGLLTQLPGVIAAQLLTVHAGRLRAEASVGLPEALLVHFTGDVDPQALHPAWTEALAGQDVSVATLEHPSAWTPWRVALAGCGLRACWLFPVADRQGEAPGLVALYRALPDAPSGRLSDTVTQAGQLMTVALEQDHHLQTILTTREETLRTLGVALEFRDYETKGHTDRVVRLSLGLARRLGLSEAQQDDLRRGAYLHDLGKIAIPDQILLKPGPLSADEWAVMRQHPVTGYEMLRHTPALGQACLEVVLHHHEHWNGGGYPHGLKGEAIPLLARVFAVVDAFDALTSARPYKQPWPEDRALAELRAMAGRVLDPALVEVFVALRGEGAPVTTADLLAPPPGRPQAPDTPAGLDARAEPRS